MNTQNQCVLICLIVIMASCGRTPSKVRFSKNLDIEIPSRAKVIKDEYQDNLQDYIINYEIKLDQAKCRQLKESILNSDFYNEGGIYVKQNEVVGVWQRDSVGFSFTSVVTRKIIVAEIDTISLIARFTESYD